MSSVVSLKTWDLSKGSATFFITVRFVTSMDSVVSLKSWVMGKGLATIFTFVKFLSYTDSLVSSKVWVVLETFSTFFTCVGFPEFYFTFLIFVGVHQRMDLMLCSMKWKLCNGLVTLLCLYAFSLGSIIFCSVRHEHSLMHFPHSL